MDTKLNIIHYFIRIQRELTGVDDLEKVHFLELKVETSDTSLGNFGINLPNLMQLKMTNSVISSIRYDTYLQICAHFNVILHCFLQMTTTANP